MSDRDRTTPENPSSAGFASGLVQKAIEPLLRVLRDEIASAKREVGNRVSGAKRGLVLTVVGAVVALVAVGLVAALGVTLLVLVVPAWAAVAITLVVFLAAAAILLAVGIRGIGRGVPPLPKDTIADLHTSRTTAPKDPAP
jgi:hypothetical protein